MQIKRTTETQAYVRRPWMTAALLALTVSCSAAAPASANSTSAGRTRSEASSALAARGLVLRPGAGYEPGGSTVVRDLQRLLAKAGYSTGQVDGRYGPMTEEAVTRYQANSGLRVDGVAGPQTLAALTAPGNVLRPGDGYRLGGSAVVRNLQRLLTKAGYAPGPIDGRFGPLTEGAVSRYQAHRGLRVDGIVGSRTFADLRAHAGGAHAAGGGRAGATAPRDHRPTAPGHTATVPTAKAPTAKTPTAKAPTAKAPPAPAPSATAPAAPSRTSAGASGHPAGPAPLTWVWLVGLLVVGLCAGAAGLYVRRRHSDSLVSQPNVDPGAPVAAQEADVGEDSDDGHDTTAGQHRVRRQTVVGANGAAGSETSRARIVGQRGEKDRNGTEEVGDISSAAIDINGAFNLGVLLEAREELAGAEAAYRRADERGHAAAASNLGVLLEARGDRIGAEAAYRRADERGEANGAFNLGVLLEAHEDLAGAEGAYRRAERSGDATVAQLARAAVLDLTPDTENSQAIRNGGSEHGS